MFTEHIWSGFSSTNLAPNQHVNSTCSLAACHGCRFWMNQLVVQEVTTAQCLSEVMVKTGSANPHEKKKRQQEKKKNCRQTRARLNVCTDTFTRFKLSYDNTVMHFQSIHISQESHCSAAPKENWHALRNHKRLAVFFFVVKILRQLAFSSGNSEAHCQRMFEYKRNSQIFFRCPWLLLSFYRQKVPSHSHQVRIRSMSMASSMGW